MNKTEFIELCNKSGIKGKTFDYTTKCLWVPEKNWFIRMMYDTTGSQLLDEDYEEGYNDYIDYSINVFTDISEVLFEDFDGGIWMFNNEEGCDVQEETWNTLDMIFDGKVPSIIWLDVNMEEI